MAASLLRGLEAGSVHHVYVTVKTKVAAHLIRVKTNKQRATIVQKYVFAFIETTSATVATIKQIFNNNCNLENLRVSLRHSSGC